MKTVTFTDNEFDMLWKIIHNEKLEVFYEKEKIDILRKRLAGVV